jgi:hypothetical protein
VGVLMVVAGGLWFVDSYGFVSVDPIVAAVLFAIAGLGLAYVGATDRNAWWSVIAGGTMLGIAGTIAWNRLNPSAPGEWGAALFLAGVAAGLWAAYLLSRDRWWALVAGGIFASIGVFVGLTTTVPVLQGVGVMLAGFAVSIALVALAPTDRRMRWALLPAVILAAVSVPFLWQAEPMLNAFEGLDDFVWPVVLLVGGALVLWRVGSQRRPTS